MTSVSFETTSPESRAGTFGTRRDSIRLSVLDHLNRHERCVCELQAALAIAPNFHSYHLRILREAGLVAPSRRGRSVDYRISDDAATTFTAALPAPLIDEGSQ